MEINQIKQELKQFLTRSFRMKEINDRDNIFASGIVHSLFFIQLLVFLEKNFSIELQDDEFDIHKLTTVDEISELIFHKIKK